MAGVPGYDPSRLFNQLLNTGLASKDQPLYQTLYLMIQQLIKLTADVSGSSSSSGGGTTIIQQTIQQLELDSGGGSFDSLYDVIIPGPRGDIGLIGPIGIPGIDGLDGEDGFSIIGPAGANGAAGANGTIGVNGAPGQDGLDGEDAFAFISRLQTTEITITTTGNIDDLDFGNADIIRMNNASLSTIRGLKAGAAGQTVTIVSVGAGQVSLAHQDTNSLAGNRLINFATSASTPLAAGVGSASYQYDVTTARWRLILHEQGAFITAAFDAANFTGGGAMTWTVEAADVFCMSYLLVGRSLIVLFNLDSTTIGGTLNSFVIISNAAYGGFVTSVGQVQAIGPVRVNGTAFNGFIFIGTVSSRTTSFAVGKNFDGDNYAASTNATSIRGTFIFPVD